MIKNLKVVSIGGFGHSVFVFDDMQGMSGVNLVGLAPAYEGENISSFTSHPLCEGVPHFDSYEQMLRELKPDVAIISTRLDLIPHVVINAAEAGCHIIAEKPLALDLKTLDHVRQVIESTDVKLTAMLSMRSEPQLIAAKKVYESGQIGEAVLINARKSYKWGQRPEWMGDRKYYGSTVGWIGIHAFDFINFITGLKFNDVVAKGSNFNHPERPDCDDHCALLSELSNGGTATISVDLFRPQSAPTHGDDWIRIVGTKGILEARGSDVSCTTLIDGMEPKKEAIPERAKIFRQFLSAVAGDTTIPIPQEESFMLTEICLRAQQHRSSL